MTTSPRNLYKHCSTLMYDIQQQNNLISMLNKGERQKRTSILSGRSAKALPPPLAVSGNSDFMQFFYMGIGHIHICF